MKTTIYPELQDFHIEGVLHISPNNALIAVKDGNAILLDVWEKYECELESIALENVHYLPMSVLTDQLESIPTDKAIIVVCAHGIRSVKVTQFLMHNRFENVASLDGGIAMWSFQELPLHSKR